MMPVASAVNVPAPAKINLFLYVTGRRPDGYHELFTLMACVGLYDILELEFCRRGVSVVCTDPTVPEGEPNTAYRAAVRFFDALAAGRGRPGGIRVTIHKHIPVAAGLGGGSSNAAAVLEALNRHYGHPFSISELMETALKVGADVPFFLHRKPAIATGIGERLQAVRGLMPGKVVMVFPGYPVSTEQVFKNLNLGLTKGQKKPKSCLLTAQKIDIKRYLHNDLETVTLAMYPGLDRLKSRLLDAGAAGALMSGSGSTVFGLFPSDRAAVRAYVALSREKIGRVFLADLQI
jgi:4-diphosphocytidyl-2-C-methyl-D-erythritol kinase